MRGKEKKGWEERVGRNKGRKKRMNESERMMNMRIRKWKGERKRRK